MVRFAEGFICIFQPCTEHGARAGVLYIITGIFVIGRFAPLNGIPHCTRPSLVDGLVTRLGLTKRKRDKEAGADLPVAIGMQAIFDTCRPVLRFSRYCHHSKYFNVQSTRRRRDINNRTG